MSDDYEEDHETYQQQYEEEDDNHLHFFHNLATHPIEWLETIVYNIGDLDVINNKEKILREKEEGKYLCSKIVDTRLLYTQI